MSSLARRPFLHRIARSAAAVALAAPLAAAGALHVYEPFDYAAPSLLDGTPANGVNLAGPYVSDAIDAQYQLRISTPGLSYGQLTGAPGVAGGKLTQLSGTSRNASKVALAAAIEIAEGQAIFFSALFRFDDSANGNHRAGIELIDDRTGDTLGFGESVVGVRAVRAGAVTAALGGDATTTGANGAFSNGQTLLLLGRYSNSAAALGDRLELIGYDTASSHPLPASFDPSDPNAILYQELSGVDIDLARISSVRFEIRGADNNYIDELRIGSTLADVAPVPEPDTWVLMLCAMAAVAGVAQARRRCRPAAGQTPYVEFSGRARMLNSAHESH